MIYHIEVYDNDENITQLVEFESKKKFSNDYKICDRLITYMDFNSGKLVIPEGVTTLSDEVFFDGDADMMDVLAARLELPESLTKIEDNAFVMANFQEIKIARANSFFRIKDRALYTKDLKRLIYILTSYDREEFWVQEGTERMDGNTMYWCGKIHIPASVKEIGEADFYDSAYISAPEGSYAIEFAKANGIDYEIEG